MQKKQARIVRAKKIDLTTMEFEDMPRIKENGTNYRPLT